MLALDICRNARRPGNAPRVVGGIVKGALLTPAMAKAVFDNLCSLSPASPFVVSAEVCLPVRNSICSPGQTKVNGKTQ
jgi:hypothetical protein